MTIHRGRHSASVSDIDLKIKQTFEEKQQFMPLLLIGDESADMIGRYLERGILYVGYMGDEAVSVCVVTVEDNDTCEVKNLAVKPKWQKNGIGHRMLAHVEQQNIGKRIIIGTGETPSTLRFYHSCGYVYSHRDKDFFIDNYPYPIIEEGVSLKDMIYLSKQL